MSRAEQQPTLKHSNFSEILIVKQQQSPLAGTQYLSSQQPQGKALFVFPFYRGENKKQKVG